MTVADLPAMLEVVRDGFRLLYGEWSALRDTPAGREPSQRMDAFLELLTSATEDEKSLRAKGYAGCIWSPKACPKADAAVCCDACRPLHDPV